MNSKLERAILLQNILIATATGQGSDEAEYAKQRHFFLSDEKLLELLPSFVRTNRTLGQFWGYIKHSFGTYQERRDFIWSEFQTLLDYLEKPNGPSDKLIENTILAKDYHSIHELWTKALERKDIDPEGAITMARSLIESTCKHILDEKGLAYEDNFDLPKLYSETAQSLNLAPDQHSEKIFKQILGSCSSVVQSLGNLRNKAGDAHGKGIKFVKPAKRHAELAVNLAGAMASFLIQTFEHQHSVRTEK